MDKTALLMMMFVALCLVVVAAVGMGIGLVKFWRWYEERRFCKAGERYQALMRAHWSNPRYDRRLVPGYRAEYTGPERRGTGAVSPKIMLKSARGKTEPELQTSTLFMALFSRLT